MPIHRAACSQGGKAAWTLLCSQTLSHAIVPSRKSGKQRGAHGQAFHSLKEMQREEPRPGKTRNKDRGEKGNPRYHPKNLALRREQVTLYPHSGGSWLAPQNRPLGRAVALHLGEIVFLTCSCSIPSSQPIIRNGLMVINALHSQKCLLIPLCECVYL